MALKVLEQDGVGKATPSQTGFYRDRPTRAALSRYPVLLQVPPMAKCEPLRNHLSLSGRDRLIMTSDEIAQLVGPLPASARDYEAWWGNDAMHVHAAAWLGAGYRVESVDRSRGLATFTKTGS